MSNKTISLLPCPFCGGAVRWCGDDPENPHDCDQIVCPKCEINFDCQNAHAMEAEDIEGAKLETAIVWNRRVVNGGEK